MTIEFYARTTQGWLVRPNIEVMQFPGGEMHIKNHDTVEYTDHYAIIHGADLNEYAVIGMWAAMFSNTHLFMPYLPAARADHDETAGVYVYSRMTELGVGTIHYIDPHSVIASAVYRGSALDLPSVVVRAVAGRSGLSPYVGVIAPDKGAVGRAKAVADKLGVEVVYATKERDPATGKLSKFAPPNGWGGEPDETDEALSPNSRWLVVDDICDGGGTFMGLASVLGLPREQLDLWVTHGVFSGNAGQLVESYGNIYTTDSHPGHTNPAVQAKVTKLLPYWYEALRA